MMKSLDLTNRILLGLVILVPGLLKLFVFSPGGVTTMLSVNVLFSWAPAFWAWVLITAEILGGVAILSNYKVDWGAYLGAIILFLAVVTVQINWTNIGQTQWTNVLVHLAGVSNYLILAYYSGNKSK